MFVNASSGIVDGDHDVADSLGRNRNLCGPSGVNVRVFNKIRENSFEANSIGDGDDWCARFEREPGRWS